MIYPVNSIGIKQGYHTGKSIDFGWIKAKDQKQPIFSADDGKVYKIEKQDKGGNVIYIKHKNCITCYAHLSKIIVKKNEEVKLGQQIGNMGATGKVTGPHLHFGIYSLNKNIYGNADIDPFDVCYVYPNQSVGSGTTERYKNKLKYYEDKIIWEVGDYKLLYDKALRKTHSLDTNTYKVKECSTLVQEYLTSKKPNDTAKLAKGTEFKTREIYKESNGRVWGKYAGMWLVLCNVDGTPQAKKI